MDQTSEAKAWSRGFAGGFAALALAIGGQAAATHWAAPAASCRVAEPSLAEQVIQHLKPAGRDHVAQRVALALLGAVLHTTCS